MPDDALFLDDGYTLTHDVAAVPGLHAACTVTYRPALDRERKAYDLKITSRDPDALEKFEVELLGRHVLKINDLEPHEFKPKLGKLHPTLRAVILNLVLSFTPAKRVAAEGNSSGASG